MRSKGVQRGLGGRAVAIASEQAGKGWLSEHPLAAAQAAHVLWLAQAHPSQSLSLAAFQRRTTQRAHSLASRRASHSPFCVYFDASQYGTGAVLCQLGEDGKPHPLP